MSIPTQDPKGYYRILGLALDADETAIKQAYRRKAFELHPDRNPSPNAVAEFQRINDAYHTLSDPRGRALYATLTTPRPAAAASPTPTSRPRPAAASGPRACSSCGQVTAQPRYIIFEKVTGRLWRTERTPISGVFCRRCAERLGFAASLHCWLKGWWAVPLGPPHTLSALWVNLRGGVKPDRENSALLLQQARAFLARGDRSLAHGLATQALALAPAEGRDRDNAERMLNALGAEPGRRLRNVWMGPGIGFWLQLLPPAGLGLVFALVALPWLREPPPTAPG
ncbi:molecular chaperone DnaJ, partial [Rhodospirillum rubrum]|uniref:J domain-containing protein n=2 Tax=Rhodospirillum rubrum TaxID=1085 RepID=UPI001904EB9C